MRSRTHFARLGVVLVAVASLTGLTAGTALATNTDSQMPGGDLPMDPPAPTTPTPPPAPPAPPAPEPEAPKPTPPAPKPEAPKPTPPAPKPTTEAPKPAAPKPAAPQPAAPKPVAAAPKAPTTTTSTPTPAVSRPTPVETAPEPVVEEPEPVEVVEDDPGAAAFGLEDCPVLEIVETEQVPFIPWWMKVLTGLAAAVLATIGARRILAFAAARKGDDELDGDVEEAGTEGDERSDEAVVLDA
jgi:hypothetical protein